MPELQAPEIVAAVQKEIKAFGDNAKANYDELRKAHEQLKHLIDETKGSFDGLVQTQVVKLTEDITTRQKDLSEKIDTKIREEKAGLTQRIDAVEVAMKRPGGILSGLSPQEATQEIKDIRDFHMACITVGGKSANVNHIKDFKPNIKGYEDYCKFFDGFLRNNMAVPNAVLDADAQKALSVGIDPDGGYTVTPTMSNRIIKRLFEADPIRDLATVETISTGAIEWIVDYGDAGGGWESETESGDETDTPKLFKKRIPVHVLYAKPRATQTLLEDSAINAETWLADKQANRFIRLEGAAFVGGDGVGKPRGFLTYNNYDTAGVDQWGRIERQNMGAAAALTADGFVDVKFRLIEQYLMRASWLTNRLTVAAAMKLKDGQGNYIWKPGLAEARHSTILGLDVRMSTSMPTVAANALSVAIADWAEAYMVVDRLGITVQRDPFTVKPYVEFYTRKRVGGDVINFQAIKIGRIAA